MNDEEIRKKSQQNYDTIQQAKKAYMVHNKQTTNRV